MNLEAKKIEDFTGVLTSHEPRDEICTNSFHYSLKHVS